MNIKGDSVSHKDAGSGSLYLSIYNNADNAIYRHKIKGLQHFHLCGCLKAERVRLILVFLLFRAQRINLFFIFRRVSLGITDNGQITVSFLFFLIAELWCFANLSD